MEISRIYLLFVQSLAIYVIMFNLESLYCILLNKIKSNQIKPYNKNKIPENLWLFMALVKKGPFFMAFYGHKI